VTNRNRDTTVLDLGSGEFIRYSDSLRAGRSGDRIPVEGEIFCTSSVGPGAHPASYTMGTGPFPG